MKKYLFRFFILLFLSVCFVPVNADNTNFKEYVNARYGFKITFPDIFTVSRESQNGDGITLLNPEKKLHLLAWGSHNVLNETLVLPTAIKEHHSFIGFEKEGSLDRINYNNETGKFSYYKN